MPNPIRHIRSLAIVTAVFLSFGHGASATECPIPRLSGQVTLTEQVISWTTTLNLTGENQNLGKVTAKFLTMADTFVYYDAQGNKIATARSRIFSWGTHIDVFDCQEQKIGEIRENVMQSWTKVVTVYSILDVHGHVVAQSEKVDWFGTQFTLFNSQGHLGATISRPWFNFFSDKWTVNIQDPQIIDPRFLVMIGAFKTEVDNRRRRSR